MGGIKLCYCGFTSFESLEQIVAKLSGNCDYYIIGGQEKCPETGRLHYHGLAYSEVGKCWKSITNPWNLCNKDDDFRKGPANWVRYCCKPDSKVDPDKLVAAESGLKPSKLIEKKSQATKSGNDRQRLKTQDILDKGLISLIQEDQLSILRYDGFKKSVEKYLLDTTELVDASGEKGIWIHGPPRVGKSYSVRKKYGTKNIYLKNQNKWWDGYNGQKIVLLDDLDLQGSCLGHLIKIWADCYGFNGENKGGTIPICFDKFIVTSNYTPYEIFKDDTAECVLATAIEERFKVIHKTSKEQDIMELI